MKRLIVAAAAMIWAGAAFAGDYHLQGTLKCSECHTMHASRSHGLQSDTAGDDLGWVDMGGARYDKLLIQNGVNETCLACHDNTAAPDVYAINESGPATDARSAGALNGVVGTHAIGTYEDWMGHTLGSSANPPGYTGSWDPADEGFHCGNCHSIHGSEFFRNLGGGVNKVGTTTQKNSGAFNGIGPAYNTYLEASDAREPTDANDDIFVNVLDDRTYATDAVEFRIGTGGMNRYCAVCHGDYHNTAGDNSNTIGNDPLHFSRHPTTGVSVGATTTVPVASPAALLARPAYNPAKDNAQAACLSCHKGHGNLRGFGIVYPDVAGGTFTNLEEGNGVVSAATGLYPIRNMCTVCHTTY